MNRLHRFTANAGTRGTLLTGAITVIVFFSLIQDIQQDQWKVTLPLLVAALGGTYAARDFLVRHLAIMRVAMNVVAGAAILGGILLRREAGPEPWWLHAAMQGLLGTYLGGYFWMFSDERVGRPTAE